MFENLGEIPRKKFPAWHYMNIRDCRSFWRWVFFHRVVAGKHVFRIFGWDNYAQAMGYTRD